MKITFVNGDRAGDELEYSLPEITIGREDGNIFRIPVPGVSRYHAKIWRNDSGQWMICDQGSTNGVKVNKKRINSTVVITENDEIEIGKQILRVSGLEAEMPKVIFNPIPGASAAIPDLPESSTPDFAPGTARPVSPEPPSAENGNQPLDLLLDSLKEQTGDLFSGKKTQKQPQSSVAAPPVPGGKPAMRKSTQIMLVGIVISLLAVIATVFLRGLPVAGSDAETSQDEKKYLVLQYVKEEITKDNIFRFVMLLEGDQVTFTIDDIKSKRHFSRKAQVEKDSLEILLEHLNRSAIWTMKQPEDARSSSVKLKRNLLVCLSPQMVNFSVDGPYAPAAFEEVESAISVLAESYDLQTIALTSDELKRQAKICFEKAEDLFNNREGRTENLRNSIVRYQQVVNLLEQFSPPPQMWDVARKRLAEAQRIRQRKLEDLNYEWVRAGQVRDFESLRRVLLQTIELTEPSSKEHKLARERLLKLDVYLRKRNQ